jgi:multidrug resistance efflux pump
MSSISLIETKARRQGNSWPAQVTVDAYPDNHHAVTTMAPASARALLPPQKYHQTRRQRIPVRLPSARFGTVLRCAGMSVKISIDTGRQLIARALA